jgi:NADH dehydrogenase (ubiquinone) Fe-S protein 1
MWGVKIVLHELVCSATRCVNLAHSGPQVHELVEKADVVKDGWNGYNVLHDAAARVAALDIGFMPSARAASAPAPKLVYLLGSDDFDPADVPADAFVIYQVLA